MGNELKVDQLKFMYEVIKVIYESPCREKLLAWDPQVLAVTIPMLTVFKTLFHMKDWLNSKEEYEEKMKKLNLPPVPKDEPAAPIEPWSPSPKKNAKVPPPPTEEEKREKERLEQEWLWQEQEKTDHEMFGRYWIWDNYYDPDKKSLW